MIDAFVLQPQQAAVLEKEPLVTAVTVLNDSFAKAATLRRVAQAAAAEYTLLYTKSTDLRLVHYALERLVQLASDSGASFLYADHFREKRGVVEPHPVIDCQLGSVRDDFDFGGLLLIRTDALKAAAAAMDTDYQYAGLYDLRLRLSQQRLPEHVGEFLYYEIETDLRTSGEKQFDYVDPKNRGVQVEMEQAVTAHLKAIGAYLAPGAFLSVDLTLGKFPVEASVVIPCKNRVRTIADALRSALGQKTDFPYNVIVVDDNSTDGTVEVIQSFLGDPKLVYIAQDPTWHGIGGNWNAAIHHPQCGRFALQLDSDDKYHDVTTVQQFVEAFRAERCAMVIGCYEMTDLAGNPLPPYVIEHREWTPENGRNNALRINGLGAPRGFWVPLLREINFPTTKYGEDYAVGLRISREYRIGRVWNVLYTCRRWEDNSDGNLSVEKLNANNLYKDRIRTWEIQARIAQNKNVDFFL